MSTALYAFQALSAALYARRDEPKGRRIEASLLQAAGMIQAIRVLMVYLEGEKDRRALPSVISSRQPTAGCSSSTCAIRMGRVLHHLSRRSSHMIPALPMAMRACTTRRSCSPLRPAIAEHPTAYWAERLTRADIMHERLNGFRDFLAQPQTKAIDLVSWLTPAGAPESVPVPNIAGSAPFADGTPRGTTPSAASTPPTFSASTASPRPTSPL